MPYHRSFSTQALPTDGQDEQAAPYALEEFNEYYGLVQPEQLVIVRSYGDDTDDQVLTEIQPRFIIMYEPNLDFVRRIEVSRQCGLGSSVGFTHGVQVYRGSTPGLSVRVYVMMWDTSAEEDKYLAEVRREKESFEKLIKERAVGLSNTSIDRFIYDMAEHGPCVTRETKSQSGSHRSHDSQYQ